MAQREETGAERRVVCEVRDEHVFLIGLNRPGKYNAFDSQMLRELGEAYTRYEEDDALWCALLYTTGEHFTAGLDLGEVGPRVAAGEPLFPEDGVDPFGLGERVRSKPVVAAARGWCLTIGMELLLACDIRVASATTRFGQIEIRRGIFPFGGATIRLPQVAGWGGAMRYLLTGEEFDGRTARELGLVQEVVEEDEEVFERALELAQMVARQAPLGVQATLRSARVALEQGPQAAAALLPEQIGALMVTQDAAEGMMSFLERREARFVGE